MSEGAIFKMSCRVFVLAVWACAILPAMSLVLLKPKHAPPPHFRLRKIGIHKMGLPPMMKRQPLMDFRQPPMLLPKPIPFRRPPFPVHRPSPFIGLRKINFGKRKPLITKIGKFPMKFKSPLKRRPFNVQPSRPLFPRMQTKVNLRSHRFMPRMQWHKKQRGKPLRRFQKPPKYPLQGQRAFPGRLRPNSIHRQQPLPVTGQQGIRVNSHQLHPQLHHRQATFNNMNNQAFFQNNHGDDFRDDFTDNIFNSDDQFDDDDDDISRQGLFDINRQNKLPTHGKDIEDDNSFPSNFRRSGYYNDKNKKRASPAIFGLDDDEVVRIQAHTSANGNPLAGSQGAFQQSWTMDDHRGTNPFVGSDDHTEPMSDDARFQIPNFVPHNEQPNVNAIDPFARQMEELQGNRANPHIPDIHRTDQSNFIFETGHQGFSAGSLGFNHLQISGDVNDGFNDVFKDFEGAASMMTPNSAQTGHGAHPGHGAQSVHAGNLGHGVHTGHGVHSGHDAQATGGTNPINGLEMLGHSHPNMMISIPDGFGSTDDSLSFNQHQAEHTDLDKHPEEEIGSGTLALLGIDPNTIQPTMFGEQTHDHSASFGATPHIQPAPSTLAQPPLPLHSSTTTTFKFDTDSGAISATQSGTIFNQTPLTPPGPSFPQTNPLMSPNPGHHDSHVTFDSSAQINNPPGPTVFGDIPQHDDIFGENFSNFFSQQPSPASASHVPIGQDVFHNQQSPVTTQDELSILTQFPSINDIDFNHSSPGH